MPIHRGEDQAQLHLGEVLANTKGRSETEGVESFPVSVNSGGEEERLTL